MTRHPYRLAIGAVAFALVALVAAVACLVAGRPLYALLVTAVAAAQALTALRIMIRRERGA